ncbi:MAG: DNA-processing protein DprA [Proteobacteria bacterium]|nr:DNA-processing protein DprA [Pseudomonadota bacterium]
MVATLDWIRLSLVPGLGLSSYWRLIDHFHSPTAVLCASRKELLQVQGIREQQVSGLFSRTDIAGSGQRELDRLTAAGGCALSFEDASYPPLLRQLTDPPPVLYVLGRKELLSRPAVAIVGSRAATTYGRKIAYNLATKLSASMLTVVSGLALGIDAESHAGSLAGQGSTVAVLGCGLDVVYPRQNSQLFVKIAETGALVSEYPLGTRPEGFRFPARNRIIAGLSKGVVVVEAAKRSGSLITAQIALDCGREVFAVPGHIDSCKSEGAHWLLKQGAKLVQSAADIIEELDMPYSFGDPQNSGIKQESSFSLDPDVAALLGHLDSYPQMREGLIGKTGFSPARISELLLFLELEGWIEMLPGDRVRKISPLA